MTNNDDDLNACVPPPTPKQSKGEGTRPSATAPSELRTSLRAGTAVAVSRMGGMTNQPDVGSAAHLVQLALTPIFMLSGVASLLNVFSTRLGRISDQVDKLTESAEERPRQLHILRIRSRTLDIAVLLAAMAGALTCTAALALLIGELRIDVASEVLFGLFGGALLCAVAALIAFSLEMAIAGRAIRERTGEAGT